MLKVALGLGTLVFDQDAQAAARVLELERQEKKEKLPARELEELQALRAALQQAGYEKLTVTTPTHRTPA